MEENNRPTIYAPEFIPYYPAIVKKYHLSDLEAHIYGFIRFYTSSTNNYFFFSNLQIGELLNKKTTQVSLSVSKLIKLKLIKAVYKTKKNGGKIRYLRADFRKTVSQTFGKPKGNNNKINNNKENNIEKKKTISATVAKKGISSVSEALMSSLKEKEDKKVCSYEWQDKALRYAHSLGINWDDVNVIKQKAKGRWMSLFKKGGGKLDVAYSFVSDYTKPLDSLGKIKMFFWKYNLRT